MERILLFDLNGRGVYRGVLGAAPSEEPEALTVVPLKDTPLGTILAEVLDLSEGRPLAVESPTLAALLEEVGHPVRLLREEERKAVNEAKRLLRLAKEALRDLWEVPRAFLVGLRGRWSAGRFRGVLEASPLEAPGDLLLEEVEGSGYRELAERVAEAVGEALVLTPDRALAAHLARIGRKAEVVPKDHPAYRTLRRAAALVGTKAQEEEEGMKSMRKKKVLVSVRGKWEKDLGFAGYLETAPMENPAAVRVRPVQAATYAELAAQVAEALEGKTPVTSDAVLARYLEARFGIKTLVLGRTEPYRHVAQRGKEPGKVVEGFTYPKDFLAFRVAAGQARRALEAA